jgi:ACS family glucarate transporter-like MFS transporter
VVSGMVSMGGQIAGAATASLTPFFASRYGWETAFTVAAGVTFVCIIPWFFVNPDRRLHTPDEKIIA